MKLSETRKVRLSPNLLQRMKEAAEGNYSQSEFIRQAIREKCDRHDLIKRSEFDGGC